VRVPAHPPSSGRGQRANRRDRRPGRIEQLGGGVAFHPAFEQLQVLRVLANRSERNLVRAEGPSTVLPSTSLRARPALRRRKDDHRPSDGSGLLAPASATPTGSSGSTRPLRPGLAPSHVHRGRGLSLRRCGARSRSPGAGARGRAAESGRGRSAPRSWRRSSAGSAAPRRHARGFTNLLPCQPVASAPVSASPSPTMHATIRSGLSKARRTRGRASSPSSPPSWIEPGVSGATWLGNAAREGELLEQPPACLRRLATPPGRPRSRCPPATRCATAAGPPWPGPHDVDHVEVAAADDPVQVNVDEVEPRRRAPVPEQPRLDVLGRSRSSGAGCRGGRSARPRDSSPRAHHACSAFTR
jgi:hypothetical protein